MFRIQKNLVNLVNPVEKGHAAGGEVHSIPFLDQYELAQSM